MFIWLGFRSGASTKSRGFESVSFQNNPALGPSYDTLGPEDPGALDGVVQVGAADSTAVQGDTASSAPEKLFTDGSVASAVPSLQEELAVASHGMGNTGDSVPQVDPREEAVDKEVTRVEKLCSEYELLKH